MRQTQTLTQTLLNSSVPFRITTSSSTTTRQQQRGIIVKSIDPPLFVENDPSYVERPCSIMLIEQSSLSTSTSSWSNNFESYFPNKGIQYLQSNIYSPLHHQAQAQATTQPFPLILQQLSKDLLTSPQPPSSTLLVARGPIPSLAAQFYLESLPLAGLVLVDPLLLPNAFLQRTAQRLLHGYGYEYSQSHSQSQSQSRDGAKSSCPDVRLLTEFATIGYSRPLKLEPGVVPMTIFSTTPPPHDWNDSNNDDSNGDDDDDDELTYRWKCVKDVADFHSIDCTDDVVPVHHVKDVQHVLQLVHEFCLHRVL